MSVFENVLLEEIKRQEFIVESYKKMLSNLPEGSIFIRKMGNSSFAYRKKRMYGKVVSEYLGPTKSNLVKEEIDKSKEYKRVTQNLSIAYRELDSLRKALYAYNKKRKSI